MIQTIDFSDTTKSANVQRYMDWVLRTVSGPLRGWELRTAGQVGFFVVVWLLAEALARRLGGRLPASSLGLAAVLLALRCGWLAPRHLQQGARLLLTEMLLFFIPAFVGLVNYFHLLAREGVRLLGAVALGTLAVMAGTAWITDRVFRWEHARQKAPNQAP